MLEVVIFVIWSIIKAVFNLFFHSILGVFTFGSLIIIAILYVIYSIIEKWDSRHRD